MSDIHLARIKVVLVRVCDLNTDAESQQSDNSTKHTPPPNPTAAAKVRNFLEASLSDLRKTWMKRISYEACVSCCCDRACNLHNIHGCSDPQCLHFLNLDHCITNKIVSCEHRRIQTSRYRKWFPIPAHHYKTGPVLSTTVITTANNPDDIQNDYLPSWIRNAAKLLSSGSDSQDWCVLAKKLGYKKNKLDQFTEEYNPSLALLTDWIISSGNSTLSVDMIITFLEQMHRDDVVEVIQLRQEEELLEPAQVFLSYQWDSQDGVSLLRERLESAGYTCWMDIGQMGAGDQLYSRIDHGIRQAKVVIACLSPKYVVSHYCNREIHLADVLRKPILPVLFEDTPWPPPGAMALIFSHLVFINIKGIGGHGGSGIHADLEDKYKEIIQRVSCFASPNQQPQINTSPYHEVAKLPDFIHKEGSTSDISNTSTSRNLNHIITDENEQVVAERQQNANRQEQHNFALRENVETQNRNNAQYLRGGSQRNNSAGADPTVNEVAVSNCRTCHIL